jgi:hypothetical protein
MKLSSQLEANENDTSHHHGDEREVFEGPFIDKMGSEYASNPSEEDIQKSRPDDDQATAYRDTFTTSLDTSEGLEESELECPKNRTNYQDTSSLPEDKEGNDSESRLSINTFHGNNEASAGNRLDIENPMISNGQPILAHDNLTNPVGDRVGQEKVTNDEGVHNDQEEEKKNRILDSHSKETKPHQPTRPETMKRKREADSDETNKRQRPNDCREESAIFPWMRNQKTQANWKSSLIPSTQHEESDLFKVNYTRNIESAIENNVERREGTETSVPAAINISISSPLILPNVASGCNVTIDPTHSTSIDCSVPNDLDPLELEPITAAQVTAPSTPTKHQEYSSLSLSVSEKLIDSMEVHKSLIPPEEDSCESSFLESGILARESCQSHEIYHHQQVESFSSDQHDRNSQRSEIYHQESPIPDRIVASSSSPLPTHQQSVNELPGSSMNVPAICPTLSDDNRASSLHTDSSLAENLFDDEHYSLSYEEEDDEENDEENDEESLLNVTKSARSLSLPLAHRLVAKETDYKALGKRKINIQFIEDKNRRHITFSKRKAGIMKKAFELSTLTGTQVLLLVASETGHIYTFATPKLQPIITKSDGKALIQACLNSTDIDETSSSNAMTSTSHYQKHHNVVMMEKSTTSLDPAKGTITTSGQRKCSLPSHYMASGPSGGIPPQISSSMNMYSSRAGHHAPKTWTRAHHHPASRNREAIGSVHQHPNGIDLIKANLDSVSTIIGSTDAVAGLDVAELMPLSTPEHRVERSLLNGVMRRGDQQGSSIHPSKRIIRKPNEGSHFPETMPSHVMEQERMMNRNHDGLTFSSSNVILTDINTNVVIDRHLQDLDYLRDRTISGYSTSPSYEANLGSAVDDPPSRPAAIPFSSPHQQTTSNATSQACRWIPSSTSPSHHAEFVHRNPKMSVSSMNAHTLSQMKSRK